jgi:hypothetical protein
MSSLKPLNSGCISGCREGAFGRVHRSHKHPLPGSHILCSSSRASEHRHVPQCPQGTNLSKPWKQNFILKVAVSMWKNWEVTGDQEQTGASNAPIIKHPGLGTILADTHSRQETILISILPLLIPVTEFGRGMSMWDQEPFETQKLWAIEQDNLSLIQDTKLSIGKNFHKYPSVEDGQGNHCNIIMLKKRF